MWRVPPWLVGTEAPGLRSGGFLLCLNPAVARGAQCAIVCGMATDKPQRNSRSGLRGVSYKASIGKWRAQIQHNNTVYHVGYFDTPTEAAAAREAKKAELNK